MKITSPLFDAFLKCATKCHLRSLGEPGSGNEYAEWVRARDESYQREAALRLQKARPETERINFARWRSKARRSAAKLSSTSCSEVLDIVLKAIDHVCSDSNS
jgi:hypothetical protein